jgi:hypothetical protein
MVWVMVHASILHDQVEERIPKRRLIDLWIWPNSPVDDLLDVTFSLKEQRHRQMMQLGAVDVADPFQSVELPFFCLPVEEGSQPGLGKPFLSLKSVKFLQMPCSPRPPHEKHKSGAKSFTALSIGSTTYPNHIFSLGDHRCVMAYCSSGSMCIQVPLWWDKELLVCGICRYLTRHAYSNAGGQSAAYLTAHLLHHLPALPMSS